jgi:hypothetical protein
MSNPETNRANAQISTRPNTPDGKQRSALNALCHGLTGQLVVMPTEDLEACQRHLASFTGEYHPKAQPSPISSNPSPTPPGPGNQGRQMYEAKGETYTPSEDGFVFTRTRIDRAIRTRQRLTDKAYRYATAQGGPPGAQALLTTISGARIANMIFSIDKA